MLASQRALFDMPREICYLNAAAWSPIPLGAVEVGQTGAARKSRPWAIDADFAESQFDRARRAAAGLINADAGDIALISSVGYGVSTAAKIFSVAAGSRVLVLDNDHSSPVLDWMTRAEAGGFTVETVLPGADHDWTAALLAAIARRDGGPVALASISSVHWSDGGAIDLTAVQAALREVGAGLLVDATHGAGVMAMDVAALDPDFLVFPTYKWLLGPYGRAFLYVAKRHQDGVPLEQTSYGRRRVEAADARYLSDLAYVDGARRFDMGERDFFVSLEVAAYGMELVQTWGGEALRQRLSMLTRRLAYGVADLDVRVLRDDLRAPHILSLGFPGGMPADLEARLKLERVYAAPRLGRLRLSPHAYNDEADCDQFLDALRRAMP